MSDGVKVNNLPAFDAKVMAWFAAVEKATAKVAVTLANRVFDNILINSPQFSGDFAANWKIAFDGSIDYTFDAGVIPEFDPSRPFQRGSQAAIQHAYRNVTWPSDFQLGKTITISNSAKHDEPYAWKIENGTIQFRPENMGASRVAQNAVERISRRYGEIDKSKFAFLKGLGV